MIITKEQYSKITQLCNKQHKPRQNKFGVIWCIRCGKLLSGDASILEKHEILIIK
jgi:hypothetical protein